MNRIIGILIVSLLFGLVTSYAAEKELKIKGKIIRIELEPAKDSKVPNLWPCLLMHDKQIVLTSTPGILQELYDLNGKEVTLTVKKLPNQKYGDKEYGCFEVSEVEKLYDQDYLSSRKAIKEFKDALQKKGIIDESGGYKAEGPLKSIWYDKNENSIIDKDDKLFFTGITAGEINGKHLIYPSQAIVRRYKNKKLYHHTFILKDPLPKTYSPAVLGRLTYDDKTNVYLISTEKIYKGGDSGFDVLVGAEKNLVLGSGVSLKAFLEKMVLVVGDKYDSLVWYGDNLPDINRQDGQYIIKVTGIVSINNIAIKPWELSTILLKDKENQIYELRKEGYVNFWRDFIGKEVNIIGALRSMVFNREENKYTPVIEVLEIS